VSYKGGRCLGFRAGNAHEFASRPSGQNLQQFWDQGSKGFDAIAGSDQNNDSDRQAGGILLIVDVLISGDQNVESFSRTPEKLAVFEPCPPGLLHRRYLVTGNLSPKVPRQGLVKQDPHPR